MNAPGVIVEEAGGLNVSVKESPTVPVFLGYFHKADGSRYLPADGCIPVTDALALRALFPSFPTMSVTVDGQQAVAKQISKDDEVSLLALQHYFDTGGGRCYFLGLNSRSDTGLATHIRKIPEISLIVCVANSDALDNLLDNNTADMLTGDGRYFLLRAGQMASSEPAASIVHPEQTGYYHPWLQLHRGAWRDDASIPVTGLTGVTSMAALKTGDRALYAQADAAIKAVQATALAAAVPPTAAVAAAYCKIDRERGIWKAPANITISNATPVKRYSEEQQGSYNLAGNNIIRVIDKQTTIWGARTREVNNLDWRYINVRRLCNQIERDVGDALKSYVFEPNTAVTWARAKSGIDAYLHDIWQSGGLQGARPEDGYRITIDETTMTPADIAAGKMIVKIQVAPVRPAEFIILQFSQQLQ